MEPAKKALEGKISFRNHHFQLQSKSFQTRHQSNPFPCNHYARANPYIYLHYASSRVTHTQKLNSVYIYIYTYIYYVIQNHAYYIYRHVTPPASPIFPSHPSFSDTFFSRSTETSSDAPVFSPQATETPQADIFKGRHWKQAKIHGIVDGRNAMNR